MNNLDVISVGPPPEDMWEVVASTDEPDQPICHPVNLIMYYRDRDMEDKSIRIYRDLGLDRTLAKTRTILGKKDGYARVIEEWSVKWGWRERCEAWDREVDRKSRVVCLLEIEKMRKQHIQLATSLQGLGAVELKKWLVHVQDIQQKKKRLLSVKDVRKLIEAGIKLERASRGEPESIIEERHQLTAAQERESLRGLLGDKKALEIVDELMESLNAEPDKRLRRK